jgi:NADPH-ferrihemoprotein reductase
MTNVFATDAVARLTPQTISDLAALSAVGVASVAYLLRGIVWDKPDPYHHVWFERMGANGGVSGPKATRDIAKKLEESVSFVAQQFISTYLLTYLYREKML